MNASEIMATVRQLMDSYEFLFNTLGADHPETWECWQQYQRAKRFEGDGG